MTTLKPPFTYFGSKASIANRIVALLPDHEHYVEPFAGSLAVLLAKSPSRMETVSDLDGEVINLWHVLRDRSADLQRVCALTPHSRAELTAAAGAAPGPGLDDLERARLLWVRLTQGRGGHGDGRHGWRHYQDPGGSSASVPDYLDGYVARMWPVVQRLHRVSLECLPALEMIHRYGKHPRVLIYADPPYLKSVRTWENGPGYNREMCGDDEHRELLKALLGCQSAVVLSGYASPLYDDLLSAWSRREIATQTGNGGTARARVEVVWSNRPFPQGHLFDLGEAS